MSTDRPRPGPPADHTDPVEASVTPPDEVDPESGTDAGGAPVENPSG
ncbi:hypothetical protein KXS11_10685 [Plantibacter flavus]